MAIAPMHHDLVLKSCKNKQKAVGRLSFEAIFLQTQLVELGIRDMLVEISKNTENPLSEYSNMLDKKLIKFSTDPERFHLHVFFHLELILKSLIKSIYKIRNSYLV